MSAPTTEIRDGIEWFAFETTHGPEEDCWCGRCGSSVGWDDCWNCGGDGTDGHDCGEDCCACLYPEDNVTCDFCGGVGGRWRCISGREWCEANPIPGRDHITSTARASSEGRE